MTAPCTIRLRRDKEPDLVVENAVLVAEVSSRGRTNGKPTPRHPIQVAAEAFGKPSERWSELRLWRSGEGAYVAEQVGHTTVPGERTRYDAWVCRDHAEVVKRLRRGWLARELYEAVGIDDAEIVP